MTVLFLDMVGSTGYILDMQPDEAEELLDLVHEQVEFCISRAGGLLVRFSGDGGVALFGWPNSEEDHAEVAVMCAQSIRESIDEIASSTAGYAGRKLQMRMGIHSGLVGIRQVSSALGPQLDVSGIVVHLAANLEKSAKPGEILISQTSVDMIHRPIHLTSIPSPWEKFEVNEQIYRIGDFTEAKGVDAASPVRSGAFVGRAREIEELARLSNADRKKTLAVALKGEPGIGKSRLAARYAEVSGRAFEQRYVVRGNTIARSTPYWAARQLLVSVVGADGEADGSRVLMKLGGLVGPRQTAILASIVDEELVGTRERASPAQMHSQYAETVLALTESSPAFLFIDDIQLIDAESIDCFRRICADGRGKHLTVVLTGRPEASGQLAAMADTVLELGPLEKADLRTMAANLGAGKSLPIELVDRAITVSDGIPLFLEQMLKAHFEGGGILDGRIPENIQSLIHARLNLLSHANKRVAQILSVLGDEVALGIAGDVCRVERAQLQHIIGDLEHIGLIRSAEDGNSVRFQHGVIADACRNMIPRKRLQTIHRTAFEVLSAARDRTEFPLEQLAMHAEGAGQYRDAIGLLWQAGVQARRKGAVGSLQAIFENALGCFDKLGDEADSDFVDFVLMVFSALIQKGEFASMARHLNRAIELASSRGDSEKHAAALCHLAMYEWFTGNYGKGLAEADRALGLTKRVDHVPMLFAAKVMQTNNLHGQGRMHGAIRLQEEICELVDECGPDERLGAPASAKVIAKSFLAWFLIETGEFVRATDEVEKALGLALGAGDAYGEVLARSVLGSCYYLTGDLDESRKCLEIALSMADANDFDAIKPNLIGRLGLTLTALGEAEAGCELFEDFAPHFDPGRTGKIEQFYYHAGHAHCLAASGDPRAGLAGFDAAIEFAREISNPCLLVKGLSLRSRILAQCQEAEASQRFAADRAEIRELCARHGLVEWPLPGTGGK